MKLTLVRIYFIVATLNDYKSIAEKECKIPESKVDFTNYDMVVTYTRYGAPRVHEDVIRYEYKKPISPRNIKVMERRFIIEDKMTNIPVKHRLVNMSTKAHPMRKTKAEILHDIDQDLMLYAQRYIQQSKNSSLENHASRDEATIIDNDRKMQLMEENQIKEEQFKKRHRREIVEQDNEASSNYSQYAFATKSNSTGTRAVPNILKNNSIQHQMYTLDDAINATIDLMKYKFKSGNESIGYLLSKDIKFLLNYRKDIMSKVSKTKYNGIAKKKHTSKDTSKKRARLKCFRLLIVPSDLIRTKGLVIKRDKYKIYVSSPKDADVPDCTEKNKNVKENRTKGGYDNVTLAESRWKGNGTILDLSHEHTNISKRSEIPMIIGLRKIYGMTQSKLREWLAKKKRNKRNLIDFGDDMMTNITRNTHNDSSRPTKISANYLTRTKTSDKKNAEIPISSRRIAFDATKNIDMKSTGLRYKNGSSVCMYVMN